MRQLFISVFLLFILCEVSANLKYSDLKLADVFTENMVLQQKEKITFWGKGTPYSMVSVEIQNERVKVRTDEKGNWLTSLKDLQPGGPYKLKVTSVKDSIILSSVYVGEVWLASGQSNMQLSLVLSNKGKQVSVSAKNKNIHFLMVPQVSCVDELDKKKMKWEVAVSPKVEDMSAIGYYFAEKIQEALNVPVGIICCYRGGIPAEAFVSEKTLLSNAKLSPILEQYKATAIYDDEEYEDAMYRYRRSFKMYNDLISKGKRDIHRPFEPIGPKHHKRPCGLYYTMLKRVIPYSIKGVIWYQGEGNAERGEQYKILFPALIKQWRKDFNKKSLPFYFVQLTNYDHPFWQDHPYWAEIREAQLYTWNIVKNTAMVVSIDQGEKNNLHPIFKQPIGERLALCVLNQTYNKKELVFSGPIFRKKKIRGSQIELYFNYIHSGLDSKNCNLSGFMISGSDYKFVEAKAKIVNNKVIVWSDLVDKPIAVRYGWKNWTTANLYNKEGFPASPFRTDNLPLLSNGVYYPKKIR